MDFTGKLGKYKIIETEDKTKTLWSEFFDEACHNLSGAYEETLYNYIQGCHIPEQIAQNNKIHVLDVGFGLGIGLKAFIAQLAAAHDHSHDQLIEASYTSMELDEDLFLWSAKETFPDLVFVRTDNFYTASHPLLTITIFIGDGRLTLPQAFKDGLLPKFTAIFQDAFSPKKNPALWTLQWFDDLKIMADTQVYLSTYSASVSIRKTMLASGWKISNAKGFGQKKTMTKARLVGLSDTTLEAELSRSPTLVLKDF